MDSIASSDTAFPRDPVCGMQVDPDAGKPRHDHGGVTYHFCCQRCHDRFVADPEGMLAPKPDPAPAPPGTKFTCPMDPEIVQDGPGDCPICGMALEPMMPSSDDGPNPELVDFRRRLMIGAPLAAGVLLLEMGGMMGLPWADWFGHGAVRWMQFLLASPVVLWLAQPFFKRGWSSIVTGNFNMWTLIAIGTGAAYAFSVVSLLAPGLLPAAAVGSHGPPLYFEAAAVILILVLLGQVMELSARDRTGDALRGLLDLAPKTARRVTEAGDEDVAVELLATGDLLRLRPGEAVPVDGTVVEGQSALDESMISGEPIPVDKQPGDALLAGTLNGTGSLLVRAEAVGLDTQLSRIVALVASAQRSRAPIQSLADTVAGYFVPAVVLVSILAFAAWMVFGPSLGFAIVAAVSVLIIACPCALGLATPMSITVAMGRGAQQGILIRDAEALERLANVDTLVIDKTGTLTEGRPEVTDILSQGDWSDGEVLALAAGLEQSSEHPLAAAILRRAAADGVDPAPVTGFAATVGQGISGLSGGREIALGNAAMMAASGVQLGDATQVLSRLQAEGKTAMLLAADGVLAAVLAVADPIKSTTAGALQALRDDGITIVMASGDAVATAKAVARDLGIDDVRAGMMPGDKSELIAELQAAGHKVAMAGDGINDAPALAAADVGIAMGTGADIALDTAGVTLVKGDLDALVRAVHLSRATMRNIRQNLTFAFIYNAAGVPIAAGLLYPLTGWLLSPMLAAAAMSLSSVSVIGNALRLRGLRL